MITPYDLLLGWALGVGSCLVTNTLLLLSVPLPLSHTHSEVVTMKLWASQGPTYQGGDIHRTRSPPLGKSSHVKGNSRPWGGLAWKNLAQFQRPGLGNPKATYVA